jgi:thiamine biosynthesis lipoprotein
VELREHSGRKEAMLVGSGMRLDLGAIAKGYALEEAALVLRQLGIQCFLLAGSGDMVLGDPPPGLPGWRVEAGVFDTPEAPTRQFLSLANTALATSGDSFQRAEIGGVRYSHIVDPRTGIGMTDHGLVTVIAPSAMLADALSTAVSVLGPKDGTTLAARHGAEVWMLRKPGSAVEETRSAGFPAGQSPSPSQSR